MINGVYRPIAMQDGRLYSEQLNLFISYDGEYLKFFDGTTGEYLRSPLEEKQGREAAEANAGAGWIQAALESERANREAQQARLEKERADAETQRAAEAIAELERLRAEIAALQNKS